MADRKAKRQFRSRKRSHSKRDHLYEVTRLPIHKCEDDLVKAVENNEFLVIAGETGSGKTTQLPQFLHRAGLTMNGRMIGVTQPRRIAAISVAHRVAEEMSSVIGELVGYQVRFDDCTCDQTLIKYMTDGCLLRELLDDPELSRYGVLILDEAHERSLDTDIIFGLVKKLFLEKSLHVDKSDKNPFPKVIIMSATLNHQRFSDFLGGCPVVEIPGRVYPVKHVYCNHVCICDLETPNYLSKAVDKVMSIHLDYPPGDILVFLTGQQEIEQCCDRLFDRAEEIDYDHDVQYKEVDAMLILPLYGSMTTDLQKRVFEPPESSIRKIVVATNIAATSLTIEGIRYVVDSGFVKQLSYNARTGLDSLNVVLISRSEAIQRAGRAGRTAPGTCFRLYTREVYEQAMTEETIPEIQRTSLARVMLHLKCMGINDVVRFQYIDPPEERMILEALRQLYFFEALDRSGQVTTLGHRLVEFPLSPGLSRAVIHSSTLGCENLVLPVAAMLAVESVFVTGGGKTQSAKVTRAHKELAEEAGGTNDFATLLYIYNNCYTSPSPSRWCREHFIHWRAVKMATNIHRQLGSILQRQKVKYAPTNEKLVQRTESGAGRQLLRQALCAGFFCNVARKGSSGVSFRTMEGHGSTVYIHPSSTLFGCEDQLDWIIYHDILWTSKIYVRTVCPIRYEWVKDLLPRLHEFDAYTLSGWSANNPKDLNSTATASDGGTRNGEAKDRDETVNTTFRLSKRSTQDSIEAARQRYLDRKRARIGPHLPS